MTEKEPTIEHNSTTAYKLDNNILKIMKVLALNELDDEAAEALTGMLVGDGIIFVGKETKFKLERIE
jgi:prolyl-tRNA editing enzyme YbaK/EbsC (Cys-tRNA(Pro) deacylase)|tara:strand:+ start:118 stop:318 length:201 start_codon:yes stop_codon:yes gene_type:complete